MEHTSPQTFLFAPEIEQTIVSLLWHQPDRLPGFMRDLDPAVHITQPHLRKILEAISVAWGELGADLDWPIVIQIIRELGHFEDCGGLEGLDEVYRAAEYGYSDRVLADQIFGHYLQMLRHYAQNRQADPPRKPDFFTRGALRLFPNKNKKSDSAPDAVGDGKIAGKLYSASAWIESDAFGQKIFKINLVPK
jgi:hypothetical protein